MIIDILAQAEPAMPVAPDVPMNPVMIGLLSLCSLGLLVTWVMVVVQAFKKGKGPLLGILSLIFCILGGLIIGWIKAKEWGIQKLMLIYTILTLLYMVLYGAVVGPIISAAMAAGAQAQ
ncbi:MAG: hypothetical protein MUF31_00705 [Akkermansiaceae bacterium]|jgi:hypothetical protein|nr:hypothetical protein [Akkermansiaceae bacterium]